MKLPWTLVGRTEWNRVLDLIEKLEARNHNLVQQMLSMKRKGYDPPTYSAPEPGHREPEPEIPLSVVEAVMSRAKPGTDTYDLLMTQVTTALRNGQEPERVIMEVHRGSQDFDDWIM